MVGVVVVLGHLALGRHADTAPHQTQQLPLLNLFRRQVFEGDGATAVNVLVLVPGRPVDDLNLGVGGRVEGKKMIRNSRLIV